MRMIVFFRCDDHTLGVVIYSFTDVKTLTFLSVTILTVKDQLFKFVSALEAHWDAKRCVWVISGFNHSEKCFDIVSMRQDKATPMFGFTFSSKINWRIVKLKLSNKQRKAADQNVNISLIIWNFHEVESYFLLSFNEMHRWKWNRNYNFCIYTYWERYLSIYSRHNLYYVKCKNIFKKIL